MGLGERASRQQGFKAHQQLKAREEPSSRELKVQQRLQVRWAWSCAQGGRPMQLGGGVQGLLAYALSFLGRQWHSSDVSLSLK